MTDRLYYHDARLLDFDAAVIEHVNDPQHVVLDRTAFYPTSGGQPHDLGTLGAARVIDVIDEDSRIVHVTDASIPLGPVHGRVERARRHDHMQQHSAQHLLSAIASDRLGWETVSVHFGADHSTVEFAADTVTQSQVDELEQWANQMVAAAAAVTVSFEDAVAAERAGLRKVPARGGTIRVVTIAGIDRSACGGTHVSRTSEIGPVLLLETERIRDHARIGFLAGARVLAYLHRNDGTLMALARCLGCAAAELETQLPSRLVELKAVRERASKLEQEVALSRIHALYRTAAPSPDGIRRILHRAEDESPALLRLMAQDLAMLEHAILAVVSGDPPTVLVATSADSGLDAGARLKSALSVVGGRGGGSVRLAQGTAPNLDVLEQVATIVLGP